MSGVNIKSYFGQAYKQLTHNSGAIKNIAPPAQQNPFISELFFSTPIFPPQNDGDTH